MKQSLKYLMSALTALIIPVFGWAEVTESFGVNFMNGSGTTGQEITIAEGATDGVGFASGEYTAPLTWANFTKATDGSGTVSTYTVYWTAYANGNSGTYTSSCSTDTSIGKLLNGYLDDCANGNTRVKTSLMITGLPDNKQYAVALILSGDAGENVTNQNAYNSPVWINGEVYSYKTEDGVVTLVNGSAATNEKQWGSRKRSVAAAGELVAGTNVMFVEGLSGSILSITSAMDETTYSRLTIAGIQIWITDVDAVAPTSPEDAETISLNFNSAENNYAGSVGEAEAGLCKVGGWNNLTGASGSGATLQIWDGISAVEAPMVYSFASKETWGYSTNVTDAFLKGYLDDGTRADGVAGATIKVPYVPFDNYSVIVYVATDTGSTKFQPVQINNTWYAGSASARGVGYALPLLDAEKANGTWGASQSTVAAYGTNALRVDGLTGPLTIQGSGKSGNNRGGIAAMQIINTGDTANLPLPVWTPTAENQGWQDTSLWTNLEDNTIPTSSGIAIDTSAVTQDITVTVPSAFAMVQIQASSSAVTEVVFSDTTAPSAIIVSGRVKLLSDEIINNSNILIAKTETGHLVGDVTFSKADAPTLATISDATMETGKDTNNAIAYGTRESFFWGDTDVRVKLDSDSTDSAFVFGGLPYSNTTTLARDIWMNIVGGNYSTIAGGNNANNWGANSNNHVDGNIFIEMTGGTANYILGGHWKDGNKNKSDPSISGDITVVVGGDAVINGSVFGGCLTAHNNGTIIGTADEKAEVKVIVKNVQAAGTATNDLALKPNYIGGGDVYMSNANPTSVINGNTTVMVDLGTTALESAATFAKNLVGGSTLEEGGSDRGTPKLKVDGNTAVTVTAPEDVTFSGNIYGGSYVNGAGQAEITGNTSVTLNGGIYTGKIIAASSAISGSAATIGAATLTLTNGDFAGATLAPVEGSATVDSSTLIINGEIDISGATIGDFNTLVVDACTVNLTNTNLTGFTGNYSVVNEGVLILPAGKEGNATVADGATLKLVLNEEQFQTNYTANVTGEGTVSFVKADDLNTILTPENGANGSVYQNPTPTWTPVSAESSFEDTTLWSNETVPDAASVESIIIDASNLSADGYVTVTKSFTNITVVGSKTGIAGIKFGENVTIPSLTLINKVMMAVNVINSAPTLTGKDDAILIADVPENESETLTKELSGNYAFWKSGPGTLTLNANVSPVGGSVIVEGTVKFNNNSGKGEGVDELLAFGKAENNQCLGNTGNVRVKTGATLDVNGHKGAWLNNVTLEAGATFKNDAKNAVGSTQRQCVAVILEGDATVHANSNFGILAGGYGSTTLNLGGHTLTKTGSAEFWLTKTAVSNGTLKVEDGKFTSVRTAPTFTKVTFDSDLNAAFNIGSGALTAPIVKKGTGALTLSGVISGEGKVAVEAGTLNLSGNNTYTGGTTINEGATLIAAQNAVGTGAISGAGTLQMPGYPTNENVRTSMSNEAWSGRFVNTASLTLADTGNWFGICGNENSEYELTGTSTGYLAKAGSCDTNVIITGSITFNNGWSTGGGYTFNGDLSGTGTIATANGQTDLISFLGETKDFAGTITVAGGHCIAFGEHANDTNDDGKLIIAAGKTANIATGKTWTATNGVHVAGTIGGTGTIGSDTTSTNLTLANGATIDASAGALTVNGGVTTTGTVTVTGATVGETVLTYTGDAPENIGSIYRADGLYATASSKTIGEETSTSILFVPLTATINPENAEEVKAAQIVADTILASGDSDKTVSAISNPETLSVITDASGVTFVENEGEETYTATLTYEFGISALSIEDGNIVIDVKLGDDYEFVDGVKVTVVNADGSTITDLDEVADGDESNNTRRFTIPYNGQAIKVKAKATK